MSESFFPQLFQATNAITPYLHGDLGSISEGEIHTDNDINPIIQDLYQQLSEAFPEAGRGLLVDQNMGFIVLATSLCGLDIHIPLSFTTEPVWYGSIR